MMPPPRPRLNFRLVLNLDWNPHHHHLHHDHPSQAELDKVAKAYGGGPGIDMTAFPDLKFADLVVDPINISA